MSTKQNSLKFSLLGMGIIATSLASVAIPQQLLAAPLKDDSISLNLEFRLKGEKKRSAM